MASEMVQAETQKEVSDVMGAVVQLLQAIKAGNVNLATELGIVVQVAQEVLAIPADLKADPMGSARGALLGALDIVNVFL